MAIIQLDRGTATEAAQPIAAESELRLRLVQVASPIGSKGRRSVERDLRILNLGKIGSESLMPFSPSVAGTVRKRVRHLVLVGFGRTPERAPKERGVMRTFEYQKEAGPAVLGFHGPATEDGRPSGLPPDRFVIEPYREEDGQFFLSVSWSSSLPWAATDAALSRVLESLRGQGEAVVQQHGTLRSVGQDPDERVQLPWLRRTLDEVSKDDDAVRFVRLDMADHSIIWRRESDSASAPGARSQFAVLMGTWDPVYLQIVAERTATRTVVDELHLLLAGLERWKTRMPVRPVEAELH